jgi:hypothetical protein
MLPFLGKNPGIGSLCIDRDYSRPVGWLALEDRVNRIPIDESPLVVGCRAKGPENCDAFIEKEINVFFNLKVEDD